MTTLSRTARFELNNPYAKYGLKRRPTFEESVGLISDDKKHYNHYQTVRQRDLETVLKVVSLTVLMLWNCLKSNKTKF